MGRQRIDADGLEQQANGFWYFRQWDETKTPPRNVKISTKEKDREKAVAAKARLQKMAEWRLVEGADMTIGIARQHYTERHKVNAPDSIARLWAHAEVAVANCKIGDPNTVLVLNALKAKLLQKYASRTARNVLNHVFAVINFVAKEQRTADDPRPIYLGPVPKIKFPSAERDPDRSYKASKLVLSLEQVQRLLAYCIHQSDKAGRYTILHRIVVMLYFGSGQRSSRLGLLPWENINRLAGVIDFANIPGIARSKNKRGKEDVPITAGAFAQFIEQCHAERLPGTAGNYFLDGAQSRMVVYNRLNTAYRKVLGIPYGGPHALRKTLGTHLTEAGEQDNIGFILGIDKQTADKFYSLPGVDHARRVMARALPKLSLGGEPSGHGVVPFKKA